MKLDVLDQSEHRLIFIIEGISVEMINALRRIMITEIPVMAIDEVIILKNDSPLYDEIVAHRLAMIPLTTDLEAYKLPRDCECGGYGCPICQVSLTCEITNTTNTPLEIYSRDLKSNDPLIMPVDPYIPIVKIDKNDKIIFEAYAILGIAKDHAKWQAVSNAAFRKYPLIELDESKLKDPEQNKVIVKLCPEKLYEISGKGSLKLKDDYRKTCTLCKACEQNSEGKIKLSSKKDTYLFTIESDGVLPFNTIIKKTFEIFNEKINEFTEKLEELNIES